MGGDFILRMVICGIADAAHLLKKEAEIVITSYSIHYTKLYDHFQLPISRLIAPMAAMHGAASSVNIINA